MTGQKPPQIFVRLFPSFPPVWTVPPGWTVLVSPLVAVSTDQRRVNRAQTIHHRHSKGVSGGRRPTFAPLLKLEEGRIEHKPCTTIVPDTGPRNIKKQESNKIDPRLTR